MARCQLQLLLIQTSKHRKQKLLKNSTFTALAFGSGGAQSSTQHKPVNIHSTAETRSWSQAAVLFIHSVTQHTRLVASAKLFMVASEESVPLCSLSLSVLPLQIGPSGWAMPHGSEKNLPEAETHIQMCYGENTLGVNDVQLLWMHRGWLWMVSAHVALPAALFIVNNTICKWQIKPLCRYERAFEVLRFYGHNWGILDIDSCICLDL